MSKIKIVTDPKTGKTETVADTAYVDVQQKLKQTRKELRDMLAGSTPFHEDTKASQSVKNKADLDWPQIDIVFGESNA